MWDEDETREPMTDAEYEAWHQEVRAKLARSLADPRPPVPAKEAFARLHRELDALDLPEHDAA